MIFPNQNNEWYNYICKFWKYSKVVLTKSIIIQYFLRCFSNQFSNFSASEAFDGTYPTNVVVTSSGSCTYIPPGIFMSTCKIDITWFPFDDQNCEMKFGSWTYNGFKVNTFSGLNQEHLRLSKGTNQKKILVQK